MEYTTKILIADESAVGRSAIREGLERLGYRNLEEAANGEEALLRMTRFFPDVVLLDVWLSKLDGIGVLRSSHTLDWGQEKEPSFILLSSVSNRNLFIEATEAGAEYCLLKPVNVGSLSEHIQSIVARRLSALPAVAMQKELQTSDNMEAHVTQIIHQIGVPAHIKGYQYLRTAILLTVKDSDVINSVTRFCTPRWQRNTRPPPPAWSAPFVTRLRSRGTEATWTPSILTLVTPFRTTEESPRTRSLLQ